MTTAVLTTSEAIVLPATNAHSPAGGDLLDPADQENADIHIGGVEHSHLEPIEITDPRDSPAPGEPSAIGGQASHEPHLCDVVGGTFSPLGVHCAYEPQSVHDLQGWLSTLDDEQVEQLRQPWIELRMMAAMRDDVEDTRKRATNRLGLKSDLKAQKGSTMTPGQADTFMPMVKHLQTVEREFIKVQESHLRALLPESVMAWINDTRGISIGAMARLLGATLHPVIAFPAYWEDDDGKQGDCIYTAPYVRSLAQLRQFCGHGSPGRKRKGMSQAELFAMGSPAAKSRLWNVVQPIIKSGGPYRERYDAHKAAAERRTHTVECPQCKGSSNVGDPWRPGHINSHAIRMTGKDILADLYNLTLAGTTVETLEVQLS